MNQIILTKDQEEACNKFKSFLLSDAKEFYLFGAAGCGKTFLVKYFINQVLKDFEKMSKVLGTDPIERIFITATTNKAVEVLDQFKTDISNNNVSLKIGTIYSILGISVGEDYSNGTTYLNFGDSGEDFNNSIVIIDECSMLPREMILHIPRRFEDFSNCKVIYIGDSFQLAPVNEKPHWDSTPEIYTAKLSIPVRNAESQALIDLCDQLRETVKTQEFKPIKLVPGVIDICDDEQVSDWLVNADYSKARVLCYTNHKAIKYIQWMEEKKNQKNFLRKGQIYINNNCYIPDRASSYYPDEMIRVLEIKKGLIAQSPSKKYYFYAAKAKIQSLRNPRKISEVLIAVDPQEIKTKIRAAAANKDWRDYFYMQKEVMDLRLPYASTIHKSQGSTFDEVLIDLGSFRSCQDSEMAARLLYVAVSRARKKIKFYGKLPKKYGVLV